MKLGAPFPYFGGKRRVAADVWRRLGDVKNYIEPFAGSLAVLLARPWPPPDDENRIEIVNDLNGWVANFWRAVRLAPEETARWADQPTVELDLHARGDALFFKGCAGADGVFRSPAEFVEKLRADPGWCDPKIAGWWVWGQSNWIGDNWGPKRKDGSVVRTLPHLGGAGKGVARKRPNLRRAGMGVSRQLPHLGGAGMGVSRQRPHLSAAGMGVSRKLPHLTGAGQGECARHLAAVTEWFRALADRLRHVRVCCGDWARVYGPAVLRAGLPCAVFLDPPYSPEAAGVDTVYDEHDSDLSAQVREWAIETGKNPAYRIALCGYEGEHEMPADWECLAWKASGGYGSLRRNGTNENAPRERIWFSPGCIRPEAPANGQGEMFKEANA